MQLDDAAAAQGSLVSASHQVLICLLGSFRVVKLGRTVPFRAGSKAEALLTSLALRDRHHAPREALLDSLWPESDLARASRSLSTLVHDLRRLLGDALSGRSPVTPADGGYELNVEAGVRIDITEFDALVARGDRHRRGGDTTAAIRSYEAALQFYRGDVCSVRDVRAIVERERMRACYLSLLGFLADHHFEAADYTTALRHAVRLLLHDPCREDAHRLVMCCYVRLGVRAQALRQYRTCQEILAREFETRPEPATTTLFARIRIDPGSV
jgi:DNA-binding SARP family transcriptional activator